MKRLVLFGALCLASCLQAQDKPNILWIFQEDTSPWMGCYDHEANQSATPVIDKLASEGVLFNRAYVPAPVCSSCRSGVIVGAPQFRFGAHEHRSRRGKAGVPLPEGMKTIPELMREHGYDTFNIGKTDYNFTHGEIYSKVKSKVSPWRDLKSKKPFFGQIQLKGGKTNTKSFPKDKKTNPKSVTVPGDYPQDDMYREIVAQHCDAVRSDDVVIGKILAELEKDGLNKNTIVVYFSDHGANHLVRHKQMPTEAGCHVPCMVRGPEKWVPQKQVRNDLISILDISATSLSWAGIPYPKWIEGQNLFAKDFTPRTFVGSARDRCDHTIDRVRTIRTDTYRYTRNFKTDRTFLQPQYRDSQKYLKALRQAYAEGTLSPKLTEIYFGERPAEELYDIEKDPAQLNNLAKSPAHQAILKEHRGIMDKWLAKGDLGVGEEPDVELVMNGNGRFKGVNPEYEAVRTDSDGDGLSDRWEKYNQRDPNDGKLQFEFDCGGWQTEGWKSDGNTDNIAGRQGFLDFELKADSTTLTRGGLKADTVKNAGSLAVRIRSSAAGTLAFAANGKSVGEAAVAGDNTYETVKIPLTDSWSGTIHDLAVSIHAKSGANLEIDWIRIQ